MTIKWQSVTQLPGGGEGVEDFLIETLQPGQSSTQTQSFLSTVAEGCDDFSIRAIELSLAINDRDEVTETETEVGSDDAEEDGADTDTNIDVKYTPPSPIDGAGVATGPNAPITFSAPSLTDTPMTLREGFGAILSNQQQVDAEANALLTAIKTNTFNTAAGINSLHGSVTNIWNFSTNIVNTLTNRDFTELAQQQETDAGDIAAAALEDLEGWKDASPQFNGSASGAKSIPLSIDVASGPFSYTMNFDPDTASGGWSGRISALLAGLRTALTWLIVVWLFWKNLQVTEEYCRTITTVDQAVTAGSSILGSNANAPAALAAGIVIVSIIGTLPTFAVAFLSVDGFNGVDPLLSGTGGSSIFSTGVYFANQFFPIATAMTAIFNHYAYRMAILYAFMAAAAVIKLIVGL